MEENVISLAPYRKTDKEEGTEETFEFAKNRELNLKNKKRLEEERKSANKEVTRKWQLKRK